MTVRGTASVVSSIDFFSHHRSCLERYTVPQEGPSENLVSANERANITRPYFVQRQMFLNVNVYREQGLLKLESRVKKTTVSRKGKSTVLLKGQKG